MSIKISPKLSRGNVHPCSKTCLAYKQKLSVANLTLFKHAHSTHSHSSLSPLFAQVQHSRTCTQLSPSMILSSRSVVYRIVVLGLFFFVPYRLYMPEEKGKQTSSREYVKSSQTYCMCVSLSLSLSLSLSDFRKS